MAFEEKKSVLQAMYKNRIYTTVSVSAHDTYVPHVSCLHDPMTSPCPTSSPHSAASINLQLCLREISLILSS